MMIYIAIITGLMLFVIFLLGYLGNVLEKILQELNGISRKMER